MGQSIQFDALCWKNALLSKHSLFLLFGEIILPVLVLIMMLINMKLIEDDLRKEEIDNSTKQINAMALRGTSRGLIFYHLPSDQYAIKILACVKTQVLGSEDKTVTSEEEMKDIENTGREVYIAFTAGPPNARYKLRTRMAYPTFSLWVFTKDDLPGYPDFTNPIDHIGKPEGFYYAGEYATFVGLQLIIDSCIMQDVTGKTDIKQTITFTRFPSSIELYFELSKNPKIYQLGAGMALCCTFTYLLVILLIAREKDSGIKMLCHTMGAKSVTYWINWLMYGFVTGFVLSVVISSMVFELIGSWILVFILVLLYLLAQYSMSFWICVLISNAVMGAVIIMIIAFLSATIALKFEEKTNDYFIGKILVSFLFPPVGLGLGLYSVQYKTMTNAGYGEAFLVDGYDLPYSMAAICLIASAIFYFLLTLYMDPILPGKHGSAAPWTWPCMRPKVEKTRRESVYDKVGRPDTFEKPLESETPIIETLKLTKTFRKGSKTINAVDNVTVEIYKDVVTVILGHNGAGKTTIINLMGGLMPPSKGRVYIDGQDIRKTSNTLGDVAVCAQENIYFTNMPVRENLMFAARMRGFRGLEAQEKVDEVAENLSLVPHMNKQPPQLSGGYKRRLCLAMALLGNAKCVLLDEPTCGLDPEARREVWNAILSIRNERSVIITTQFMEEADVLGEKIVIISNGKVLCYGSPGYLRKLYDTGYTLTVEKQYPSSDEITRAVEQTVGKAPKKAETPSIVKYTIPTSAMQKVPNMFAVLERDKNKLGILSLGMSVSSIEDVYIKSNKYEEQDMTAIIQEYAKSSGRKLTGCKLLNQRFRTLLWKEGIYIQRMWVAFLITVVVLILFFIVGILVNDYMKSEKPSLEMRITSYRDTTFLYTIGSGVSQDEVAALHAELNSEVISEVKKVSSAQEIMNTVNSAKVVKKRKYMVSLEIPSDDNYVAYYSMWGVHTASIAAATVSNIMIRKLKPGYSITTVNHPLPQESALLAWSMLQSMWIIGGLMWCIFFINFAWLHVEENVTLFKHLQLMAGAPQELYWLTRIMLHYMMHVLVAALVLAFVVAADALYLHFFVGMDIAFLWFTFLAIGFHGIPFIYIISFGTKSISSVYVVVLCIYAVCMIVNFIKTLGVEAFVYVEYILLVTPLMATRLIFDEFILLFIKNSGCRVMKRNKIYFRQICKKNASLYCCGCTGDCNLIPTYYTERMLTYLVVMVFFGCGYLALLHVLEYGVAAIIRDWCVELSARCRKREEKEAEEELIHSSGDADVTRERNFCDDVYEDFEDTEKYEKQVLTTTVSEDLALLVYRLQKRYKAHYLAVKSVSFSVRLGECFGMLGHNGAGKSTTFGMLTGAHMPTNGNAIAGSRSLKSNCLLFGHQIGYCPQTDALVPSFTGAESACIMACLRGVPADERKLRVNVWFDLLDAENLDMPCRSYSAGNKRKLNTALAMIGEAPLLFLDEPTSGVDLWSRRKLWSAMKEIRRMGQSVVLTSHSMDECEALCDRLSIMSTGRLLCLGTIAHLKNKFRQGFTLRLRLRDEDDVEAVKEEVLQVFAPAKVVDEHGVMVDFRLTDSNLKWSQMFETMQHIRDKFPSIEDYVLSDTTLEEIFLSVH